MIILFTKTRRLQPMDNQDKIEKEPDPTNPENLPEYIWPFIYLFNKKKFKKLLKQWEWDYKINLMEDILKNLNTKTYAIIIKKYKALNQ